MAGQDQRSSGDLVIDELIGLSGSEQAEKIADHYASISNLYKPIQTENFLNFMTPQEFQPPKVTQSKVAKNHQKYEQKSFSSAR